MVDPPQDQRVVPPEETLRTSSLPADDLASGRGFTYEWENQVIEIQQQIAGGVVPGTNSYVFQQSVPASTWTINHGLGDFPSVLVLDSGGAEMRGEVHYPNDQTVVIVHSQPYSGTAYLRL